MFSRCPLSLISGIPTTRLCVLGPIRTASSTLRALHIDSLLSHAGVNPSASAARGLSPSIDPSTTFERAGDNSFPGGHIYSRMSNPTRANLESAVAGLEVAGSDLTATGSAFSSGMAAVNGVIMAAQSLDNKPAHLLLPDDCYHGVPSQLVQALANTSSNVTWQLVDMTDESAVTAALASRPTARNTVLWLETPSNPLCKVSPIASLAAAAKAVGEDVIVVVDSTWAPPNLTQPLRLGADVVVHSATKYMGGHSDVLCGVVVTQDGPFGDQVRGVQASIGAVPSPFDCFLVLRGLRSMAVRVNRSCESAMGLARFLEGHERVEVCHYPGLESHAGHEVSKMQMGGQYFGGMLSFEVVGGGKAAIEVASRLKLITRATSLGGTESLIEHRASIEPEGRVISPEGLLRMSVGLEDLEDLKKDLEQALKVE